MLGGNLGSLLYGDVSVMLNLFASMTLCVTYYEARIAPLWADESTRKYTQKTQNVEIITSQKDHKRWTSFVYSGSKLCQLLLYYTSFATRSQNVIKKIGHEPSGGQIVSHIKQPFFIMHYCWISSKYWNRLSRPTYHLQIISSNHHTRLLNVTIL